MATFVMMTEKETALINGGDTSNDLAGSFAELGAVGMFEVGAAAATVCPPAAAVFFAVGAAEAIWGFSLF